MALLYLDVKTKPMDVRRYERSGLPGRVRVTHKAFLSHIDDHTTKVLNLFLSEPESFEVMKPEPEKVA